MWSNDGDSAPRAQPDSLEKLKQRTTANNLARSRSPKHLENHEEITFAQNEQKVRAQRNFCETVKPKLSKGQLIVMKSTA